MFCEFLTKASCCLGLLLFGSAVANQLSPDQYDARLCSAQLLVMNGDLIRLQEPNTKQIHKTGLKQRIAGALGTLGWLCRQIKDDKTGSNSVYDDKIKSLRKAFVSDDWQTLSIKIASLKALMPLGVGTFDVKKISDNTLKTSMGIYKHYCKGCHTKSNQEIETPAYSLFVMAKNMPEREFLARMLLGVHGTPKIALRNPLTDDDIAGMTYYFKSTNHN